MNINQMKIFIYELLLYFYIIKTIIHHTHMNGC